LGEGQIAEFVQNDEINAGEVIGEPVLSAAAGLCLKAIDEIDDIVEPAAGRGADAASRDGDGEMRLAGSRSARSGPDRSWRPRPARRGIHCEASISVFTRSGVAGST
jgi:hypothetical protein